MTDEDEVPAGELDRLADDGCVLAAADPDERVRPTAAAEELVRVTAERDKLQRFKDYVHGRLDRMGVPADPDSPHKAEGCRVGGRLDWVAARLMKIGRPVFSAEGDVKGWLPTEAKP